MGTKAWPKESRRTGRHRWPSAARAHPKHGRRRVGGQAGTVGHLLHVHTQSMAEGESEDRPAPLAICCTCTPKAWPKESRRTGRHRWPSAARAHPKHGQRRVGGQAGTVGHLLHVHTQSMAKGESEDRPAPLAICCTCTPKAWPKESRRTGRHRWPSAARAHPKHCKRRVRGQAGTVGHLLHVHTQSMAKGESEDRPAPLAICCTCTPKAWPKESRRTGRHRWPSAARAHPKHGQRRVGGQAGTVGHLLHVHTRSSGTAYRQ